MVFKYKKIGIPLLDNNDNRVLLIPEDIKHLTKNGFSVCVTASAGLKAGYSNKLYQDAGARIVLENSNLNECEILLMPSVKKVDFFKEFDKTNIISIVGDDNKFKENEYKNIINWIDLLTFKKNNILIAKEKQDFLAGQFLFYLIQGNQSLNSGILFSKISGIEPPKIVVIGDSFFCKGFLKEVLKSDCEITYLNNNYESLDLFHGEYGIRVNTLFFNSENFIRKIKEADIVICSGIDNEIIRQSDINNMKKNSLFIDADFSMNLIDIKREKNFFIHNNIKHYIANSTNLNQSILKTSSLCLSIIITDFLLKDDFCTFKYVYEGSVLSKKYKSTEILLDKNNLEKLLNEDNEDSDISWLDIEDNKDY